MTAQASTSGTSIDFTGIPSYVKRITVMFNGVSANGSSNYLVQVGSGSITSSGYGSYGVRTGTTGLVGTTSTNGYVMVSDGASSAVAGHIVLTNISGNIWVSSHATGSTVSGNNHGQFGGGSVTLGGVLDRIRFTTANGTDTFDAGSINIMYE